MLKREPTFCKTEGTFDVSPGKRAEVSRLILQTTLIFSPAEQGQCLSLPASLSVPFTPDPQLQPLKCDSWGMLLCFGRTMMDIGTEAADLDRQGEMGLIQMAAQGQFYQVLDVL